jgi:hypothetical protein
MKRTIVGIVTIAALAIAVGLRAQQEPKSSGSHLGTWQLASYKYGTNQQVFTDFPKASVASS